MNSIVLEKALSYIKILLGTILTAAAFGLFILPAGYCSAGVTGLSRFISSVTSISISTLVLIVNVLLLLFGLITLGFEVIVKSIAVSLLFPMFLDFFIKLNVSVEHVYAPIPVIMGGLFLGCGIGIILNCNCSAGGFDLLGLMLNKKFGLPIAIVMNICDSIVILLQAIDKPNLISIISGLFVILISNLCVALFTKSESKFQSTSYVME